MKVELKSWLKTILIVFFFRAFVASGYEIKGSCMEPQLTDRDRVIVNKLVYRIHEPMIGDVVVFPFPVNREKDFVKRVVGLPGDLLEIKAGSLFRNGKRIKEPYVSAAILGDFGPVKVPENKLFVLGDNRNNSYDSRFWGFVEEKDVAGRVEARFWPPAKISLIPQGT